MVCMRLSTRVFGWRLMTGDVIALCHSDDFMFAKDTGSHVVKKMEETDCNFLYADGIFVNEQNTRKVVRVNYLYNCHLKVAYLPEFVMRMGGMSSDSAKRKKVWDEDIRVYSGYGFKPVTLTKLMKMAWKVPQFIKAKFIKTLSLNVG